MPTEPIIIHLPWVTLTGTPDHPGRWARLRCMMAMAVHEVVELVAGTSTAHSMKAAQRYAIGSPYITVPASRRNTLYLTTVGDFPTISGPLVNYRVVELRVYASGTVDPGYEQITNAGPLVEVRLSNPITGQWELMSVGDPGAAAEIYIGTTETSSAGTAASVVNIGTSASAVLNFTIPQGPQGEQGPTGPAGTQNVHDSVYVATTTVLPNSPTYTAGTIDANGGYGIGAKLTSATNSTLTVDSTVVPVNSRVLVKNQADPKRNGIYTLTTAGGAVPWVLTRATDYDNHIAADVNNGDHMLVVSGPTNTGTTWMMSATGSGAGGHIIIGTDNITFTRVSGVGPQGPAGPPGAGGTIAYWGSWWDTTTQTVTAVNTRTFVTYDTIGGENGISIENGSEITFAHSGVYNIQFSAQLHNEGGGGNGTTARIWLTQNGVDVPESAGTVAVPSNNPYVVTAWNYVFEVTAGDYFEIAWATDNANIVMLTNTSAAPAPTIPSIIVTATQVTYTQAGPTGATGSAATVGVGTVYTSTAGSNASVINAGNASAAVFDFYIPQGAAGTNGTNGAGIATGGTTGQVLKKTSNTNYDTSWLTLGGAATLDVGTTPGTVADGSTATNNRYPTSHASSHANNGSDEISIDASQITSGVIGQTYLGTGTSGSATVLHGDSTWSVALVRAATTQNITLSGTQTIDGVALAVNDFVLVKDQSNSAQNGVYKVASSTWTLLNADTTITVSEGTTNKGSVWSGDVSGVVAPSSVSGPAGATGAAGTGVIVLGATESVPVGTADGTIILRRFT